MLNDDELLSLRLAPARLGALAAAHRRALVGEGATAIAIEPAPAHALTEPAAILRGADVRPLDAWPEPSAIRAGDRIVLAIPDGEPARAAFLAWLARVAATPVEGTSVAPVGADAAGLHKLWCIAAARLRLPASIRIEVRHDLVGIALAQIALGSGADVLAGPVAPDRTLPLAGVTRPTEHTRAGLRTLVRQAGLRPLGPTAAACPSTSPSPEVTP